MNQKLLVIIIFHCLFFLSSKGLAQVVNLEKGYYITPQRDTIKGYFDLEFLENNKIGFNKINDPTNTVKMDSKDIVKIVLETGLVVLPQTILSKGQEEKIYISSLSKGKIMLYRGFTSKNEEIFYISSDDIPDIKRINKSDPQTFLYTYFKMCDDAKRIYIL